MTERDTSRLASELQMAIDDATPTDPDDAEVTMGDVLHHYLRPNGQIEQLGRDRIEELRRAILAYDIEERGGDSNTLTLAELHSRTSSPWPKPASFVAEGVEYNGHTIDLAVVATGEPVEQGAPAPLTEVKFRVCKPSTGDGVSMETVTLPADTVVTPRWGKPPK